MSPFSFFRSLPFPLHRYADLKGTLFSPSSLPLRRSPFDEEFCHFFFCTLPSLVKPPLPFSFLARREPRHTLALPFFPFWYPLFSPFPNNPSTQLNDICGRYWRFFFSLLFFTLFPLPLGSPLFSFFRCCCESFSGFDSSPPPEDLLRN